MEFAPGARDYVAAKLMSRVGLRVNEARTLDLADVKLTRTTSSTSADPLDVVTHHVRPHVATTVCPTLLHRHLQRRQHPITGSSPTPKPDSLLLPRLPRDGEDEGRAQGVGVVLTQDPATAGQGVLTEPARPLKLP